MSLLQRLERLLFGYTAEEAAEIRLRWTRAVIDQRIAQALATEDERTDDDSADAEEASA